MRACRLCGTPVPGTAGDEPVFCCSGCARVYDVLSRLDESAGTEYLEAARRLGIVPLGNAPTEDRPALPPDPAAVRAERLEVTGLTCPSCSWVLEQVLGAAPGVESARVDFFTGTAALRLDLRVTSSDRLIQRIRPLGYGLRELRAESRGTTSRGLKLSFVVCAVLFVNMMSLSSLRYFEGLGWVEEVPTWLSWVEAALLLPVLFLGWLPMLARAGAGLWAGRPTMDLLIAVAVGAATGLSFAALLSGRPDIYFETAAGLVTISLLSRMIEAGLRDRAASELAGLLRMPLRRVRRLDETGVEDYAELDDVAPGDRVRFEVEEPVPFDGVVRGDPVHLSEAVLTGESRPRRKLFGDGVIAGSVVVEGRLDLEVTRRHGETRLHEVTESVRGSLARAEGTLRSADRIAAVFVPVVLLFSFALWVGRLLVLGPDHALSAPGWFPSVAVLAVACPCAFSLAGVAALTAATGALLSRGLLVREPGELERLHKISHLVFDKTGTLSEGAMAVDRLVWRAEPRPEILPRVLAAEEGSFHPAADAIRAYAAENGVSAEASPEEVRDLSGQGRSALFEGAELRVGARSLFRDPFDPKDPRPNESAVWFGAQGRAEGCLLLADRLRPDAAQVMAAMRSRGYTAEILSGDRQEVCHWAAAELGVEAARGEATLDEKVEHVRALQEEGLEVAFVGDGTNDALAMREAATSVALARSTDEALAAAGFVVLHGSLSGLPELFATGRKLARVIRSNYAWAFAFNAVFIPVAAAGKLVPLAAMLLMLASSTAVLLNSLRLRRR